MPKVFIFAGANGSGKSTLAKSVLEKGCVFVNADDIRHKEKLSFIDAGNKALCLIDENIKKRKDFSFETTMAGLGLAKRFKALKKNKYEIIIFYLFVSPLDLLIERVRERVKKGGHFVEEEDVRRRYYRSLRNFWYIYKNLTNKWYINDNKDMECKNIAIGSKSKFDVINAGKFQVFKEVLKYAEKQG